MARDFTPKEYQDIAIAFMRETPRCALFAGMGLGKTVSALTLAELLFFTGTTSPVLVLGPLRVARDTWPTEVRKWNHLRHMHIAPVVGDKTARLAALHQRAEIFTVNYENLPWLLEALGNRPWPFRTVIADESSKLKGFRVKQGGKRAHALSNIVYQTDRWINLTGTPAANGLKDLWGQFWFLDQGKRLGRTHEAFMTRWFTMGYDRVMKPTQSASREIYAAIDDITLAIRPEDWFDLEKPIENQVRVTLPPAARKLYKQFEKDMFVTLACGTEVEAFNAAALTNKCRQLANGAIYTEEGKWSAVHDEKLDALDSVIEEAGGAPVMVAYDFRTDLARILQRFKDAVDISTPKGYKQFINGEKQIGVAHPASMGHGIDGLQEVCNRLVYFGHDWNLETRQQILERIGPTRQKQSGFDRPVWVTSIVAEDTLDDVVLERHVSKRETQDLLMEAMSKRGI